MKEEADPAEATRDFRGECWKGRSRVSLRLTGRFSFRTRGNYCKLPGHSDSVLNGLLRWCASMDGCNIGI